MGATKKHNDETSNVGLLSLLESLTTDERVERVIQTLAEQAIEDWERMRQGKAVAGSENHALDVYVPPHISIRVRTGDVSDTEERDKLKQEEQDNVASTTPPGFERLARGIDDLIAHYVMGEGGRVILYEDAGAGKTVFTWKLREALSRLEKPCLALRFEKQWETDIEAYIAEKLKDACKSEKCDPTEIAQKLLEERRVVLIFDAADQQASEFLKKQFHASISHEKHPQLAAQLRIVVTSRAFRVREQEHHLFQAAHWQHACAELFNKMQQENFKHQLSEKARARWSRLVPNEKQFADQLRFPEVLRMIREIVEDPESTKREPFHRRADLYLEVAERRLKRTFKSPDSEASEALIPDLKKALGCLAFEMMIKIRERFGYAAPGDLSKTVPQGAFKRFARTYDRDPLFTSFIQRDWQACEEVLSRTEFTDRSLHSILEIDYKKSHLSFRSLKMLEFFAGWYLANLTSEEDIAELESHVGERAWYWPWRFAIELAGSPEKVEPFAAQTLTRALGIIFSPPKGNLVRPTELMYRAWTLFQETMQTELKAGGERVIASFQSQFFQVLQAGDVMTTARVAAQLLPDFALREIIQDDTRLAKLLPESEKEVAFVRCPPSGNSGIFWMGGSTHYQDAYDGARPRHPVRLAPFWMQSTSVTVEQYTLFDPAFAKSPKNQEFFELYAKEPDCPIILTNWFDATMFSIWTGNSLPTEAQHAFAESASQDGEDKLGGNSNSSGPFDHPKSHAAKLSSIEPYQEKAPEGKRIENQYVYAGTSLPVRWDAKRRNESKLAEAQKPPPLVPNAWGLWQMNGNVAEWCSTEFDKNTYAMRAAEILSLAEGTSIAEIEQRLIKAPLAGIKILNETFITSADAYRIFRGRSWGNVGHDRHDSARGHHPPDAHNFFISFRLCRCLPSPQPS